MASLIGSSWFHILVPANATREQLQKLVATTVGALPEEELVRDGEFVSACGDKRDHQIDDESDEEIPRLEKRKKILEESVPIS